MKIRLLTLVNYILLSAVISASTAIALHVWDENYKTEPYYIKSKTPLVVQYDNGLILDLFANAIVARGEYPLTGFGAKSKEYTETNAIINAKKALVDLSGQLRVNADERLGYLTSNDSAFAGDVNKKINELARDIHYRILPMKMVLRVTTSAKYCGKNSLLGVIYPYLAGLNNSGGGDPAGNGQTSPESGPADALLKASGGYTGLIIDATGLKIELAIDPSIVDASGKVILGKVAAKDLLRLTESPKIEYVHTLSAAYSNKRAGKYPLTIKAKNSVKNCDPVVTEEDGQRILKEDGPADFLKGLKIVFVI